jgi:hypothetical protein
MFPFSESALKYTISNGVCGALARTFVAPVERTRLLMQAQTLLPKPAATQLLSKSTSSTLAASSSTSLFPDAATAQQRPYVRGLIHALGSMWKIDGNIMFSLLRNYPIFRFRP